MKENLKIPSELIELAILKKCSRDISFFIKIKNYLDTSKFKEKTYFNDKKYQKIFNLFCLWFNKFEKFPKEADMIYFISKLQEEDDLKLYLNSIVTKVYNEEIEFTEEAIEDETLNFIKEARVYEAMLTSQVYLEKGQYNKISEEMQSAVQINFDKDLGKEILDPSIIDSLKNTYDQNQISSGFPNLDQALGGGFTAKTLTLVAGLPGLGKSIFLGLFAVNAFLQGKNVLIYTLEMSQEKLAGRIYSNIFNQTRTAMLADTDAFKEKLKNFNPNGGSLIIKEYPSGTACANDLMAHTNDLRMYRSWKPDIIFIDYLLIMAANDKSLSSSESYQYFKSITIEARNIGKILNIPIVSATQLNRGAQQEGKAGSKNTVTSQNLSESRAILDNADFLFTIIQTERDKKDNHITLFTDKARDEANNSRLHFKMDYEHMKASVWEAGRE